LRAPGAARLRGEPAPSRARTLERLAALPHAAGADLLRKAVGKVYATGLAGAARPRPGQGPFGGVRSHARGEVVLGVSAEQQKVLEPLTLLMATLGQAAPPPASGTRDGFSRGRWALDRVEATGFAFSTEGAKLVEQRARNWDQLDGTREKNNYDLGTFLVDRMLALAPELRPHAPAGVSPRMIAGAAQRRQAEETVPEFHREIGKLAFHSWLVEVLGLSIDIEVPVPQLAGDATFFIASVEHADVSFTPEVQVRVIASAADKWHPLEAAVKEIRERPGLADGARKSLLEAAQQYRDGCLRVARSADAQGRAPFVLEQLDIDMAMEKVVLAAQNQQAQFDAGVPPGQREAMLGSLATTGLSLLMRKPSEQDAESAKRLDGRRTQADAGWVDLYAEDLVIGFRPDLSALAPAPRGDSCRGPWKSLVGRQVSSLRLFGSDALHQLSGRPRDEAIVTAHARTAELDDQQQRADDSLLHFEELFRWTGWNLAVPSPEACEPVASADGAAAPTLAMSYASAGALPRQRFGWGYRLGLRAVYADGKSIALEDASRIYDQAAADCVLGTAAVGGSPSGATPPQTGHYAPFFRYEPILPPDVHLTRPLQLARTPTARAERVVVASDEDGRMLVGATERVLVPPRVNLEAAIRTGAFDDPARRLAPPEGAFAGVVLNPDGSFPAVGRSCIAGVFGDHPGGETAYVELPGALPPDVPYLPDPWARRLILGIYRAGDDELLGMEYFDHYAEGRAWPDCRRLALGVEAAPAGELPPAGYEAEWRGDTLAVRVAAGVALRLRCWYEIDEQMLGASGVVEAMASWLASPDGQNCARDLAGMADCCDASISDVRDRLIRCLSRWHERHPHELTAHHARGRLTRAANLTSFSMLNPARSLDVLHAVPVPVRAPRFSEGAVLRGARHAILPATAAAAINGAHRFEAEREAPRATAVDFAGDIEVHRASTAKLDCVAEWDEYTDEVGARWQKTRHSAPMFSIAALSPVLAQPDASRPELAPDNDLVSLDVAPKPLARGRQRNEDLGATAKRYDFGDAKARHVHFRLRAASRFGADFASGVADAVRESGPTTSRWVRATVAPAKPEVAYIVPLFESRRQSMRGSVRLRRRGGWFRVWLERPWFTSGEGELLALACWPADLLRPRGGAGDYLSDKAKQVWGTMAAPGQPPEHLARLYTGWGLDPIWEQTGVKLDFIPPGAFANRLNTALIKAVPSQFHDGSLTDTVRDASDVALALYRPEYDEAERRWYADIRIAPEDKAYFPFVRLGLARYQPNAIKSCQLSEIVTSEFVQLAPDRSATIRVERKAGEKESRLRIAIAGVQAGGPAADDAGAKPRLVLRIDQAVPGPTAQSAPAWIPLRDRQDREEIDLPYNAGQRLWTETELRYRLEAGRVYSAYLEEREGIVVDASPYADQDGGPKKAERIVYADRIVLPT
jgi:hypothetical protein